MIENDSAAGWNRSYFCRMCHLKIVVEEDQKCLENDLRIFLNESSQHAKILWCKSLNALWEFNKLLLFCINFYERELSSVRFWQRKIIIQNWRTIEWTTSRVIITKKTCIPTPSLMFHKKYEGPMPQCITSSKFIVQASGVRGIRRRMSITDTVNGYLLDPQESTSRAGRALLCIVVSNYFAEPLYGFSGFWVILTRRAVHRSPIPQKLIPIIIKIQIR